MSTPKADGSQVTRKDLLAALPQLTERECDMERYEAAVIDRLSRAADALDARDARIAELRAREEATNELLEGVLCHECARKVETAREAAEEVRDD